MDYHDDDDDDVDVDVVVVVVIGPRRLECSSIESRVIITSTQVVREFHSFVGGEKY
jgi:hypothetical protein